MSNNITYVRTYNVSKLSSGFLLSAAGGMFVILDLQTKNTVQEIALDNFISAYCKYSREFFNMLTQKIEVDCYSIYFDNAAQKQIEAIIESNCLLF